MAYVKTTWNAGVAPGISAANLNKLETQYDEAKADLDAKMHATTGHKHTGGAGDAPNIAKASAGLGNVANSLQATKAEFDAALHATTGHKHTGAAGDAPNITPAAAGADPAGSAATVQGNLDAKMHATTGHKHTGAAGDAPNIAKANVGLANVTNDAQLPIAGGTMTGVLYPQNNTSYTTGQARRIILSIDDPSGGGNGDVWLKYEA